MCFLAVKNLYLVLERGIKASREQLTAFFERHLEPAGDFCDKFGIDPQRDEEYGGLVERAVDSLSARRSWSRIYRGFGGTWNECVGPAGCQRR
jgi:hypothetical protein